MPRASDTQKAQRLNRARELLRQFEERAQAVTELAREYSISLRQAHRYIQQAQQLKQPIPVSEGKLAFTVKLPRSLIQCVRLYARARKLPVSEVVTRTLRALVQRGQGRG
jgi:predicted DNA-binding transcriptional regulator YafY